MTTLRKVIASVFLAAACTLPAGEASAQSPVVRREFTIKAGVLATLAKCVTWPEGETPARGEALVIGVLGKDPFDENGVNQLDRIAGEKFVIKRFASAKDYKPCHILFVSNLAADKSAGESVAERMEAARAATKGAAVLIVGESPGLARRGATANLIFDRATNLIRLEINPDAAVRDGLKLAPDLLRLKMVQIVRDSKS
jgi:hypothetical protein